MNYMHSISRELVMESLEKKAPGDTRISRDPVVRQFQWRRMCSSAEDATRQTAQQHTARKFSRLFFWRRK
jgi:hypothetical protein